VPISLSLSLSLVLSVSISFSRYPHNVALSLDLLIYEQLLRRVSLICRSSPLNIDRISVFTLILRFITIVLSRALLSPF
jgi:hypothetical protein